MNHPLSENILKVIGKLKSVIHLAVLENHLDMDEPQVLQSKGGGCGTTHCHGGWYAVATCDTGHYKTGFSTGANQMANDLGFRDKEALKDWASKNPNLWGNDRAFGMFCDEAAFISEARPSGAKTLQHIIDHWREVYERVLAIEQKLHSEPFVHECDATMPKKVDEVGSKIIHVYHKVSVPETISKSVPETILS